MTDWAQVARDVQAATRKRLADEASKVQPARMVRRPVWNAKVEDLPGDE